MPPPPLRPIAAGVHPLIHTHPWPLPLDRACLRLTPPPSTTPRPPPQVCNKFSAAAIAIKSPLVAVRPLMAAAAALQPGPTHFTPLHAEFLKAPPPLCMHVHHARMHIAPQGPRAQSCPPPPHASPPARRLLPPTSPPPRPITPITPSTPYLSPSLTGSPAHPPSHRSASSPRPTPPPCRCCNSHCCRQTPAVPRQTLARPLPDPCQTLVRPLSDPAAALGPWRGMLIEAREDARSRGEAPLHWRQVGKAATLVMYICIYTHVHRWTRRRRW